MQMTLNVLKEAFRRAGAVAAKKINETQFY